VNDPGDDQITRFEAWYEQDMPRLFNYISYRVRDEAVAEDLTSAVCEKAIESLHRYDALQSKLDAWIFGIARNELMHYYRHRSRTPQRVSLDGLPELVAEGASVEEIVSRTALTRQAIQLLDQLDDREQEIIALRYGADLTSGEIARLIDLTPGNVRVVLHRAMDRLHTLLVNEHEANDVR
jgi:RNA polymerase sigma factor (sigma-70 family)